MILVINGPQHPILLISGPYIMRLSSGFVVDPPERGWAHSVQDLNLVQPI